MKVTAAIGLLSLAAAAAGAKHTPRNYETNDYYVLELDSSTAPDLVAERLGLRHEGELSGLDGHHIFAGKRAEQDIVKPEIQASRRRKRDLDGFDILDGVRFAQRQVPRGGRCSRAAAAAAHEDVGNQRPHLEFELLNEDESEGLNRGEKGAAAGGKGRRTRGGELYDAFAGGSDDEEEFVGEGYHDQERSRSREDRRRVSGDDEEQHVIGDDSDDDSDDEVVDEKQRLGGGRQG
ncbi:hypothetical protein BN1723_009229 [Verticillium longisporum]|uniref:Peptidase S8 pro-domain domain-containing protein n=1 Tax=Verticillium longisporum TaxID=100787 RepID=A0A0G4KMK4_VERLO|nr:hypothetical protein BN1723_009229 [Verticillium longisporum]